MLSNLFQTLYNFFDRKWLANYGTVEIAALQLSWPLIFLVISLGTGLTVAGTTLVAQYTGAGKEREANLAAGQVLAFSACLAVILGIVGYLAGPSIIRLMGAEPALAAAATIYFRIIISAVPITFGTFVVTALLNGVGDTVTPMLLMGVSVAVNIALDPLLIFGWGPIPEMGVAGAAVATVASRAIVVIVGFILLFSGRLGLHIRPHDLRPRASVLRQVVSIGGLSSIGNTGTAIGFSIMNGALARIGTTVISAFGIGNAFISLVLMPSMGLGQATASMVGQNLGAGKPERARRSAWSGIAISSTILITAAIVVIFTRDSLLRMFTSDPEVLAAGRDMLFVVGFAFPFMGILEVVRGTYQGSGHTFYSMMFDLFRLWGLRVPLVFLLAFGFGLGANGVWWAMFGSNSGTALVSLLFFLSGRWMHRVIKTEKQSEPLAT